MRIRKLSPRCIRSKADQIDTIKCDGMLLDLLHPAPLIYRTGDEPVYEFPPGFRMLAGDPNRRTFDESDPAQDAVRYVCLGSNIPEGHGKILPFLQSLS
jgi:hypothetical protein